MYRFLYIHTCTYGDIQKTVCTNTCNAHLLYLPLLLLHTVISRPHTVDMLEHVHSVHLEESEKESKTLLAVNFEMCKSDERP